MPDNVSLKWEANHKHLPPVSAEPAGNSAILRAELWCHAPMGGPTAYTLLARTVGDAAEARIRALATAALASSPAFASWRALKAEADAVGRRLKAAQARCDELAARRQLALATT